MQIISMKQLREHFEPIREGLESGESYLLMYRSKPLGTLLPYNQDPTTKQTLTAARNDLKTSVETSQTQPIPTQPASPIAQPVSSLRRFGLKHILNPK